MAPDHVPLPPRAARTYDPDSSAATLVALLVAVTIPLALVAVVMGWRPIDPGPLFARASARPVAAMPLPPGGWAISDGWFYGRGTAEGGTAHGYAVTDADGLPFWTTYQRLGGPSYLGYPLSRRYTEDGAVQQVFQRGILRATEDGVAPVYVLDQLHTAGHDADLAATWTIPEAGLPLPSALKPEVPSDRVDWVLRDYPALAAYRSKLPDPTAMLGLPTSEVRDVGSFYVVRFQGGALQQWKEDVAWAKAGEVTAVNVGEIADALGVVPAEARAPDSAAPPAAA